MQHSHTLSSARRGRCSKISMGSVSAAITTNSEMPRFSVLVAAQTELDSADGGLDKPRAETAALTLVCPFTQLLVVCRLLNNVQNGVGKLHEHTQS